MITGPINPARVAISDDKAAYAGTNAAKVATQNKNNISGTPVSYTHLTLPTSDLV